MYFSDDGSSFFFDVSLPSSIEQSKDVSNFDYSTICEEYLNEEYLSDHSNEPVSPDAIIIDQNNENFDQNNVELDVGWEKY